MSKQNFKRINLWVNLSLYEEIKKQSAKDFLRIGTWCRQLIEKEIRKNNSKSNKTNKKCQ